MQFVYNNYYSCLRYPIRNFNDLRDVQALLRLDFRIFNQAIFYVPNLNIYAK